MKAIGSDGRWHEWSELTAEEQRQWTEAMNEADRIHDRHKEHGKPMTLPQSLLEYHQRQYFIS